MSSAWRGDPSHGEEATAMMTMTGVLLVAMVVMMVVMCGGMIGGAV